MSFLTLDLNLLRVFDAVMTEQNLTRAASRLAMTQPAVSNALKRLRDTLNDELLIRTAHGVKPTQHAEELWPVVRRALTDLETAITPETFDVSRAHTTFQMAMADATAALWLPGLVRTIEREAPQCIRYRRLCHCQSAGCTREVLLGHDGIEDTQQIQVKGKKTHGIHKKDDRRNFIIFEL